MELPKSQQNNGYLMMFGIAGAITSAIINSNEVIESYGENYVNLVKEGIITVNTNDYKGIIFDINNKQFEIISTCSELNSYANKYNSGLNLDCRVDYSIDKQREILNQL